MKLTAAEDIGRLLDADTGRTLWELVGDRTDLGPVHDYATETSRYDFPDGSVLIVSPDGWGLGYPGECMCREDHGHAHHCEHAFKISYYDGT